MSHKAWGQDGEGVAVKCCAVGDLVYIKASIACGRMMEPSSSSPCHFHTSRNIMFAPLQAFFLLFFFFFFFGCTFAGLRQISLSTKTDLRSASVFLIFNDGERRMIYTR